MPSITIEKIQKEISYQPGETLLNILVKEKIFVDNPCNGKGVCGKCKVCILDGKAPAVSETEKKFLSEEEIEDGVRLSCLYTPDVDLRIELLHKERKHEVLTSGYVPEFTIAPNVYCKEVEIRKPSLIDQTPFEDQIKGQIGDVSISEELLKTFHFEEGVYSAVVYRNHGEKDILLTLEKASQKKELYGVAVDIGTTTVVTSLIDLNTGKELANASMINAQKQYGLDVLTRITYEMENPENGAEKLQQAIVESINDMVREICIEADVSVNDIYEYSVGANCTMMHMLLGIDAASIGRAPYAPIFVRAKYMEAKSIGLIGGRGVRLYCLPSVSAYIGADIVAGAYVCSLHRSKENILFIDIGTNGEIVYSDGGRLMSCSCAAGPALEGMNISSGMRAAEGAVEDVKICEEGIDLTVIGNQAAEGICGSGILAVVKELLRIGVVKKDGAFIKLDKLEEGDYRLVMLRENGKKREFVLTDKPKELLITQGDVRQVQLAKGAILSGFYALLRKVGKDMGALNKVMIAGQFGAHLPADSLIGVGILPEGVREKLIYVGNSSKTGAYMALLSADVKQEMEEVAQKMDYMELGATEGYERLFAECLMFS